VARTKYSEKFKARMIQRMTGARRISANALSKEVGVAQPTLSLWLREASRVGVVSDNDNDSPDRRPEEWSPQEKMMAVLEARSISDGDLGGWLRRKGLKVAHLRQWEELMQEQASAVFSPREPKASVESRRRVKQLEKELGRKDKALAETSALLVLQGKMEALWAEEDDPTRQSSGAASSRTSRKRKRKGRG